VTDAPLANPRQALALPGANPANKVVEMTLKPGTVYLEGPAASQIHNPLKGSNGGALFGEHATGGARQMFLPQENIGELFTRSGATPIKTVGGTVSADSGINDSQNTVPER
jgi:hypothetical protein